MRERESEGREKGGRKEWRKTRNKEEKKEGGRAGGFKGWGWPGSVCLPRSLEPELAQWRGG